MAAFPYFYNMIMTIWKNIKKYVPEWILLLTTAMVCLIGIVGYYYLLDKFELPEDWINFIGGCLVYMVTLNYSISALPKHEKKKSRLPVLLRLVLSALPVLVIALVFYLKLIRMPYALIAYALPGIGLALVVSNLYEHLLKLSIKSNVGKNEGLIS